MTGRIETGLPAASTAWHGTFFRNLLVAVTAFLTVVDLFATQAILPTLVTAFGVSPGAMGVAVNASTMGMAIAGLVVAALSPRLDRRNGIAGSLLLLSIPTMLLASAPNLWVFTLLRVTQGLCMATAFTLTLAFMGETIGAETAASAFAAYITGNVASNLFGRLLSAGLADHLGLAGNFYGFALLNVLGAALVWFTMTVPTAVSKRQSAPTSVRSSWLKHFANPALRASFGIGFCILFAFIGTFTYVNFVLVREPFGLGPMALGVVYFVFAPSIVTTPMAGLVRDRLGTRRTFWGALAIAGAGLPLLLTSELAVVLTGMVLVAIGTFMAQAMATAFVGRAASSDRASASGVYLASYFMGGLLGTAVLGPIFDRVGWAACVTGIGLALAIAGLLAVLLNQKAPMDDRRTGTTPIGAGHSAAGAHRMT